MFKQITILGPGLLGASLAKASKKSALTTRIVTWSRRPESRKQCLEQDWCDAVYDEPESAVQGSDLVVICTPVETISDLLKRIAPNLAPNTLVTDVGSTKASICAAAVSIAKDHFFFVGSHPMAGSEKTGLENARTELFDSAACIVTPDATTPAEACSKIKKFWEALKMQVYVLSPTEHDLIIAHISHLPHLLATTLSNCLAQNDPDWAKMSGPGLRDTTRVAGGDPGLWLQILSDNNQPVLEALTAFEENLSNFKSALLEKDNEKILQLLKNGKAFRDTLNND
jgi:prephenate dehydrogenase